MKKKTKQNSIAAVMAAARTVIAFPRVSYYPRSTTPFIHGDDASRRVRRRVQAAAGLFLLQHRRSFRLVFSFTSTSTMSNGRGNSHRNTTRSVSH